MSGRCEINKVCNLRNILPLLYYGIDKQLSHLVLLCTGLMIKGIFTGEIIIIRVCNTVIKIHGVHKLMFCRTYNNIYDDCML